MSQSAFQEDFPRVLSERDEETFLRKPSKSNEFLGLSGNDLNFSQFISQRSKENQGYSRFFSLKKRIFLFLFLELSKRV